MTVERSAVGASTWSGLAFDRCGDVHAIHLNATASLFCERTQQLFELNSTASLIWAMLIEGHSPDSVKVELVRRGASVEEAARFCGSMLLAWMRAGFIAPRDIVHSLAGPPRERRLAPLDHVVAEVSFFREAEARHFDEVFGHLASEGGGDVTPTLRLSVAGLYGHEFLFSDGVGVGMCVPAETAPSIKALLTSAYCDNLKDGYVTHGALLSRNGKRVLISGSPGAGKTTLALALSASGFRYAGDDIVRIGISGLASGVPFAAAAKPGSWGILSPWIPQISTLQVFQRADGKSVRYVAPSLIVRGEETISVIVILDRVEGAPVSLSELPTLQAMRVILGSGFSRSVRLKHSDLELLASRLSKTACYRMTYSDLADAVAAVSGIA